ncbi:MAG: prepilin-type N-terminal cleavage/methylation domain-containing protein [Candidatus Paceibacterota bacterium]
MLAKEMMIKPKKEQGFTLIETFVAITVLLIAVLGPMSLLSSALREANYVKNEVLASHLAQEGAEVVLSMNPKGFACSSWNVNVSKNYKISYNSEDFGEGCPAGCPLVLNSDGYYESQDSGSSIFTRQVSIKKVADITNGAMYQVESIVRWQDLFVARQKKIPVITNLFVNNNVCESAPEGDDE